MSRDQLSGDSIRAASKSRAKKSSHGGLGAAGVTQDGFDAETKKLSGKGQSELITLPEDCTNCINIGLSWNNIVVVQEEGLINQIFKKMKKAGVDLDLGCLYELQNGDRGCLQAFGELFGNYDKPPYIHHQGDERTGDTEGYDEVMQVNSQKWSEIKRILVYCYIYEGPQVWEQIHPEITLDIPGLENRDLQLNSYKDGHAICALASLTNVNNAMKAEIHAEYFRSHASMDRAFGFGLRWEEGNKN